MPASDRRTGGRAHRQAGHRAGLQADARPAGRHHHDDASRRPPTTGAGQLMARRRSPTLRRTGLVGWAEPCRTVNRSSSTAATSCTGASGRGGMAEVYLARDRLLDRPVAVKILFPEFATDPSFVARFRREAQAAANLNHPNIVGVYDWGKERGTYYIVMEYVEGQTVSEIIRSRRPHRAQARRRDRRRRGRRPRLRPPQRRRPPRREARQRAHHPAGEVKVADFGIAQAMTAEQRGEPHPDRLGHGHRHLLLARAGPGQAGRPPQRPLLARRRALRDGRRASRRSAPTARWPSPTSTCRSRVPPLAEQVPGVPRGSRRSPSGPLAKDPDDRYPTATTCAPTCCASARASPIAAVERRCRRWPRRGRPAPPPPPPGAPVVGRAVRAAAHADARRQGRPAGSSSSSLLLLVVLAGLLFAFGQTSSASSRTRRRRSRCPTWSAKTVRGRDPNARSGRASRSRPQTRRATSREDTVLAQNPAADDRSTRAPRSCSPSASGIGEADARPTCAGKTEAEARASLQTAGLHQRRSRAARGRPTTRSPAPCCAPSPARACTRKDSPIVLVVAVGVHVHHHHDRAGHHHRRRRSPPRRRRSPPPPPPPATTTTAPPTTTTDRHRRRPPLHRPRPLSGRSAVRRRRRPGRGSCRPGRGRRR